MTLAASGVISTADIASELGRAGTTVSTSDADVLALIGKSAGQTVVLPTDFWGKSRFTIVSGQSFSRFGTGSTAAVWNTDGTITKGTGTTGPVAWGTPTTTGIGTSYWMRVTPTSGTFTGGIVNTWLQLNLTRSYTVNAAVNTIKTVVYTLEFSKDAGATVVATFTGLSMDNDRSVN
jgi:hypothetical protein